MIKEAIEERGHGSFKEVARHLGVSKDLIYNLASGRTSISKHAELVEDLRKFLKKPSGWPLSSGVSGPAIPISEGYAEMPYAGLLSAGRKLDWRDPYESDEVKSVPSHMSAKGRFCGTIDGDSMMPMLMDGDLVVFQSFSDELRPRPGMIVCYRHSDMTATVKQLKHNGERYVLHALNPSVDDVLGDGVALGMLIAWTREIGRRIASDYDPDGLFPKVF